MKRILVIDDSDAVRETVAFLLEGDFAVVKRVAGAEGISLADVDQDVELLIIGIASPGITQASALLHLASRQRFAVLFLVDTKSIAQSITVQENIGCLVKPFNPYELRAEVTRLVARPMFRRSPTSRLLNGQNRELIRYIEFPYVSRLTASLARRFAATRLPILISGEMGCGQERVARAMRNATESTGPRLVIGTRDINAEYLAELRLELASWRERSDVPGTLLVEEVDRLSPAGQYLLVAFIEEEAEKSDRCRIFTTSKTDLLERVYNGGFLESLY